MFGYINANDISDSLNIIYLGTCNHQQIFLLFHKMHLYHFHKDNLHKNENNF